MVKLYNNKGSIKSNLILFVSAFFLSLSALGQTTTTSGNWSVGSNWSGGVSPTGASAVSVTLPMTVDVSLSVSNTFTINAPITNSGAAQTLTINNGGTFNAEANSYFQGAATIQDGGTLTVYSGDTVTVAGLTANANLFGVGSTITVQAGGVLIINGNFNNYNFNSQVTNNGTITVNGSYTGIVFSSMNGSGNMTATGGITDYGGTVNGSYGSCTGNCSSNSLAGFTVSATPAGSTTICSGSKTLTATVSPTGTYTYQWYFNGNAISGATTTTYAASTAGTYTLTATTGGASSNSNSITLNVGVPSAAGTIYGTTSVCEGNTAVEYNTSTVTGATSYAWTLPTGATGTSTSYAITADYATATTSGNVTVTPKNSCGNGTASSLPITVNASLGVPTITAGGPTTFCSGGSVTLTSSTTAGATYQWNNSSGAISGATNSVYSATTASSYTVTISKGACSATSTATTVTVNTTPAAPTTITPTSVTCANTAVTYTVGAVTGATSYVWTIGGITYTGGTSTTANNPITFTAAGTGTIAVAAVASGCTSAVSPTQNITVSGAVPTGTLGAITGVNAVCSGTTGVTYSVALGSATNVTSYLWTLPGASTITAGSGTNSITATMSGASGNVVATPVNGCGNGAGTSTEAVTINTAAPTGTPTVSGSNSVCSGTTNVTYTASGVTNATTYTWTLTGTGSSIVSGQGTNALTVNWGTASGSVKVTPSNGCGNGTATTYAVTVNPNLPVSVSIAPSANPVCSGTSVTFTATPTNGGSAPAYQWKVNGANVGTSSATYAAAFNNGDVVTCVLTSNATCATGSPATSASTTMTVNPNLPVSVSIAPSANPICSGTSVTFTATPTNGGSTPAYQWKKNGANVGTNSATYTFGTFANGNTVTCTLTSNATCATGSPATSATTTMTVYTGAPTGTPTITGSSSVCSGATNVTYTASGVTNATTYTWVLTGTGSSIVSGQGTNTLTVNWGTASGSVKVTPSNACASGTATTNAVTVNAYPTAPTSIAPVTAACSGTAVTYTASGATGTITSYTWTIGGVTYTGGTSTTANNPITWTAAGTGTIAVAAVNSGCASVNSPTQNITVNSAVPGGTLGAVTGLTPVCSGTTGVSYSVAIGSATNVVSYSWTLPGSSTITAGSGTNSITATISGASGNVVVKPVNGCGNGAGTSTEAIVINTAVPSGTLGAITGANPVSTGETGVTYTVAIGSAANVTSYSWSVPTGASITSGATTNTITVNWGTASSGNVVATPVNGCGNGTGTSTDAVTVTSSITWAGTTNTDWATASNWSPATVPTSSLNVIIPLVGNQPIISSSTVANCNNITINTSASLTLASGSALNVYGTIFANSGTITDNGGTTSFVGSSGQTYSGPSGGTTLSSLTLNNSAGLTLSNPVTVGGTTTVGGTLTLTSGTLASGGNLTVNLYKGGISGAGTGAISGNLTVTKHVDTAGYHYISAPMPNCSVSDIDAAIGYSTEYFYTMFWYNETNTSTADSIGWTNTNNATNYPAYPNLTSMQGYALYFYNPGTLSYKKTYTTNNYTSNIALTSTISGNVSADGWNLVGNPYPSSINWNASGWTKTGIDSAVYFYNPATHTYASYATGAGTNGGTNIIPSMQAYWVHVTSDGDNSRSLGITNSASVRSTTGSPLLWRSGVAQNYLSITATSSDSSLIDESIIRILPGATDGFDPGYDAYKLMSDAGYMSLFSRSAGDSISINSLSDTTASNSVPLFVSSPAGSYNFNFTGALSFQNYDVILTDKLLGTYQDLKQSPTYAFTLAGTDTTPRFYLNLRKAGTTTANGVTSLISGNKVNEPNVIINNNSNGVTVSFVNTNSPTSDLTLYNILGENIWENKNADVSSGSYFIDANAFPSGIYILKVIIDSKTYSKKIYLAK